MPAQKYLVVIAQHPGEKHETNTNHQQDQRGSQSVFICFENLNPISVLRPFHLALLAMAMFI